MTSSELGKLKHGDKIYLSVAEFAGWGSKPKEDFLLPCEFLSVSIEYAAVRFLPLSSEEQEKLKQFLKTGWKLSTYSGIAVNYFRFLTRTDSTTIERTCLKCNPPVKHVVQVSSRTRYRKQYKVTTKVYKTVRPDAN